MPKGEIVANWEAVKQNISDAVKSSGRTEDSVRLVAVSKTWSAKDIQPVVDAGQLILGENKLQEGQEKIPVMSSKIEWHYIGKLQRNKARKVLPLFPVIHSIDSLKLARYIDNLAKELDLHPTVLLQVNIGAELSKGGFSLIELKETFKELSCLEHLQIRGLMCIPPSVNQAELARPYFKRLRELKEELELAHHCRLPELSMGMSNDYEIAIEEGATLVRVGSSIFGHREYSMK